LSVRISEADLDAFGMGIDFREIQQIAREVVADFDHSYRNDLEPFQERHPTAELLAKVVFERAAERLAGSKTRAELVQVEAWEMSDYRVTYRPG
jgi:6-pyruvoyl-tetrahydropterin synthase